MEQQAPYFKNFKAPAFQKNETKLLAASVKQSCLK